MTPLWHPYATPCMTPTLEIIKGEGIYAYDIDGREYINGSGGLWNITLGVNNKEIISRMEHQLNKLSYGTLFTAAHTPAKDLAKRLVDLTNGEMEKVYLSTTGSSAVEVALRVAKLHQRTKRNFDKKEIVSFDRAYHGSSWMNLSASGIKRSDMIEWDDLLPGFHHIPSPLDEKASLTAFEELLNEKGSKIAAFIMEPILGSGGIIKPSTEYCKQINTLCEMHDVLLICDEVATGGGRCGGMFASKILGLNPDIITLSKALNSGYYPLGATLFKKSVVTPIESAQAPFMYGSTQDGNPVACAAALATLDYVATHNLYERSIELGERIRSHLNNILETSVVSEIRGMGIMLGVQLAHKSPFHRVFTSQEAYEVRMKCQEEGLLLYHFDSGLSLFPPMTMTDDECDDMLDILTTVLSSISS
ncbi:MAG: aspartate aminotransferase family protein [Colwellia sp.]|nr:aspartate aminotransferase family protein [Colwellia sp.]